MRRLVCFLWLGVAAVGHAATFGTATTVAGGATDLVLDEARARLYVVNSTQNRIDVYATATRKLQRSITVGVQPLSAAMSRDYNRLYVTTYQTGALDIIDLESSTLIKRVSLPAAPEGVAVGADERVLITTVGSGTNNADNRLMLYNPNANGEEALRAVPTTLPAASVPGTTTTPSRVYMSTRSNLTASADGKWIIGLNNPTTSSRQLFVFEVASASIVRARTVTSISNVLSVAPDGSRFMAGLSLFDTETLAIVAQQNTANSAYPFASSANFNTQQNQGGSVFAPDGATVYSAFNIAPVQNPTASPSISQLMLSDSENLLIRLGLQLPENLTGNMVISAGGDTIYALSQSGFMTIPISTMYEYPIAWVDTPVAFVANDQCGASANIKRAEVNVRNLGKGRVIANASVQTNGVSFTFPIAGQPGGTPGQAGTGGFGGGAGGGAPGGAFPITLPVGPGGTGGGTVTIPPGTTPTAGNTTLTTPQQTAISSTAPSVSTRFSDNGTVFTFSYNAGTSSFGTATPTDFLVQAQEAINIPAQVRVFQNWRNAEATGTIVNIPVSISTAEGLVDIVRDNARERVYIANSGLNRVEVYDTKNSQLLTPIKVGQLPRSLAMTPNGKYLYVANSGGESISIIDLDLMQVTGKVKFPPVTYNASYSLITPSLIAATQVGLEMVMSDGTLWKVVDNAATPRKTNSVTGTSAITSPRTMVATPGGENVMLLGGGGTAYLYEAAADDYILSQTVVTTPIQGYFGPVAAGTGGAYYIVNGKVLNASLTPAVTTTTTSRPVAGVAAVNASTYARFTTPTRSSANASVTDFSTVEVVDITTGMSRGSVSLLEGPLTSQIGTQRANVNGRTMVVDSTGTTAYVLTVSGLSVVTLPSVSAQGPGGGTPGIPGIPGFPGGGFPGAAVSPTALAVNSGGVVNAASYRTAIAPGNVVSIFGQNLASSATGSGAPMPSILGGTCVTVDGTAMPLILASPTQINFHLPPSTKTGTRSLVVRSIDKHVATSTISMAVQKYAPAVIVDSANDQAAVYHSNGLPVSGDSKAKRDEALVIYAMGLGVTHGATITAGSPTPASPAATTDTVQVFFGDPNLDQSEMIVDSSRLVPGLIGVYQINIRVPGFHSKGDALPVTLKIGGISSPSTGNGVPTVAVE